MAITTQSERLNRYFDLSGGIQRLSSRLLMKDNELVRAENARFSKEVGGVGRRDGYEKVGDTLEQGQPVLWGNGFFHKDGNMLLASVNNSTPSATNVKRLIGNTWTNLITTFPVNCEICSKNYMDMSFVVGCGSTGFATTTVIKKDGTVSTTENVLNAPKAKYIIEYKDSLYAINVEVNGVKYPNRAYKSSTPMDYITQVNGDTKVNGCLQLEMDTVRYLKPGMKIDIYGEGSNVKKVDSLEIISVDKGNNVITFSATNIDVLDRDEVYLEDKRGTLVTLWNTDYPTTESSDFLEIKIGNNETPDITGASIFNNRLYMTTQHSTWKWDGANLVCTTKKHGNLSHYALAEVGGFLLTYERSGVWAHSPESAEPQLLSGSVQEYINAINPSTKPVGIGFENTYKLWVGELGNIEDNTTSTSTSSTSTSSTSSSTSSTSTSSTSTSSTSTSSTTITTSTSSTSNSTSSTSSSTSSTSLSTSSTSTSTTTVLSSVEATILVYDFTLNAWSIDKLDRNMKSMFLHKMHGLEKIYFGDETGRVFRGDTGNTDNGKSIPFLVETKRVHQDRPEERKKYRRLYVYTKNGQNAIASISLDGKDFTTVGQLNKNFTVIELGDREGNDISLRVTQNDKGEACWLLGWSVIWLEGENSRG